jgi:hypothetical protein
MRLTVSYAENKVDISFDYEGLDYLLRALRELQTYRAPDHDHLISEEWGGDELTVAEPTLDSIAHELTLTLVGTDGGRDEIGSTHPVYRDGHTYGDRKTRGDLT